MMPNETVIVIRADLIAVLRHLNQIVVSLDHIGSAASDLGEEEFKNAALEFLIKWDVFRKLAQSRHILDKNFPDDLGDDGMSELEREFQGLEYWHLDHRIPEKDKSFLPANNDEE
jgi:hypothetical protein